MPCPSAPAETELHDNILKSLGNFMQLICICLADFRSMAAKIAATKKKEKIASFISNEGMYDLTRWNRYILSCWILNVNN